MNLKLITFSALITAIVGAMIGIGAATAFAPKFQSRVYRELPPKYVFVGAAAGLIIGGCQEALRQLKKQRDAEEAEQTRHRRNL